MRLLLVSDVTSAGGVDTYLVMLATGAARAGFDVDVLINEEASSDALAATLTSYGLRVHRGRLYHRTHAEREQCAAIGNMLRHCFPQVVHVACGVPWSCLAARELIVETGTPLLFTEQYVAPGFRIEPDIHERVTNLYLRAARVVCVCEENKLLLRNHYRLPAGDAIVIPNAVCVPDTRPVRSLRRTQDTLRVVTAARLVHQKGIDTLIAAAALLPFELQVRFRLTIFGDGPLLQDLKALACTLGISSQVEFRGWCKEAAGLMGTFDLFVLPSRSEGQPFALLEAMAAGVPVIASAVSGNPEALAQGRCGILVAPDDPETLAQAIVQVDNNPASAEAMAQLAFWHIRQQHHVDLAVARHVELWRAAITA